MEVFNTFFDGSNGHGGGGGRRGGGGRVVIDDELVEVPNPGRRSVYAGMSLAEAARRGREDEQARRESGGGDRRFGGAGGAGERPNMPNRTSSTGSALEQHRQRQRESSISNGTSNDTQQDRPRLNIWTQPRAMPDQHHHPDTRTQTRIGHPDSRSSNIQPVATVWNSPAARRSIARSGALSGRQSRWRDPGSRDTPVLVESDSD